MFYFKISGVRKEYCRTLLYSLCYLLWHTSNYLIWSFLADQWCRNWLLNCIAFVHIRPTKYVFASSKWNCLLHSLLYWWYDNVSLVYFRSGCMSFCIWSSRFASLNIILLQLSVLSRDAEIGSPIASLLYAVAVGTIALIVATPTLRFEWNYVRILS